MVDIFGNYGYLSYHVLNIVHQLIENNFIYVIKDSGKYDFVFLLVLILL